MTTVLTPAEQIAKKACDLPEFRSLNVLGIKGQVAEILAMIGRVEGIFSTYTKHDISHIEAMLGMLDWLVPPETQEAMTPVDYLLIVLAIYFHDLGMVVTDEEYRRRMENQEFLQFLEKLQQDVEAKDYLARAEAMTSEEKDRFFYQEFVRMHHASRIREWVTGRHSRHWGETMKPITEEIDKIMKDVPLRFREHLAVVCESHHKDDLNRTDLYPLAQRYGNHPVEMANVQYAALLLRTADLIHVTKDRTPSVMYKTINFSDLKSVEEWDKQRSTFAVYMRGRVFDSTDEESHVIEVSADFTEERPFFALAEYLAWADSQINQTKRWADKSQQVADGKDFFFPWHTVQGDIRVEGNLPQQMRFELDRGRLLNLLVGHTIYNDATVAVRELLQNSIDAVRFQYYLELQEAEQRHQAQPQLGRVLVTWSPGERELVVEDNGTGMDLDVIQNHLLRVGSSFYDTPQFQTDNNDFTPISKFGIGVLTCFMISDSIEIVTCRSQEGRRIRMTSVHADYLLKDLPPGDPQLEGLEPHGTRVRLRLRPSVDLEQQSILDILRQWIILPVCEVTYLESGGEEQKIGFKTPEEALQYLYSPETEKDGVTERDSRLETLTVKPQISDGAEYDLAFSVRHGTTPERSFAQLDRFTSRGELTQSAVVCIEGIRADWHLPGFAPRFPALLSVRDNKRFRTTVSRSSLEVDEEYRKVATACAEALFSYITAEVQRISTQNGRPLSQASTAGFWLYKSLLESATQSVVQRLGELYQELSHVVVEYVGSDDETSSGRDLSSLSVIAAMPEFWTVESRAVDLLGIISRDLGRELNVVRFLSTLAPELNDPQVNCIIVDAHWFAGDLLKSHIVTEAKFSATHQRSLLRWQPKHEGSAPVLSNETQSVSLLAELLSLHGAQVEPRPPYRSAGRAEKYASWDISWANRPHMKISVEAWPVAEVNGDLPEAYGVSTRLVTVIAKDKEIGKVYQAINEGLVHPKLVATANETNLLLARIVLNTACSLMTPAHTVTFRAHSIVRSYGKNRSEDQLIQRSLSSTWQSLYNDATSALREVGLYHTFTNQLDELVGGYNNWFDASAYWQDWERLEE